MSAVILGSMVRADWAASSTVAPRVISQRPIPVPESVSVPLQEIIGQSPADSQAHVPVSVSDWSALVAEIRAQDNARLIGLQDKFKVHVKQQITGGVNCYWVAPRAVNQRDQHRLLLGVHGGGFAFGGGESGLLEAIEMAGLTGIKVLAIDYRMPPQYPFPAAVDDVMAVWKIILKTTPANRIGVFGSSAGGGLVLSFVQRAKKENLALPAAIIAGTPWSDLSKTGDGYFTNAGVDNALVGYDGLLDALAHLYANHRDLKHPLLSPIYGDFSGFPPTFLISGTRDLFLSNTIRVQRKLQAQHIPTTLVIEEGQSHGQFLFAALTPAPEARDLYAQMEFFLDHYLAR